MIKSPAKILKLWDKINDRFGPEEEGKKKDSKKKPGEKEKTAQKQAEKITKGLTTLRNTARGGVKTPSQVNKYERVRTKVLLVLSVYCRTLRSQLEGFKDLGKYRKNVRQLTVVVDGLVPALVDPTDESEADLNDLAGVDDSQLDKRLEDPALATTGDDVAFEEESEEVEEQQPQGTTTEQSVRPTASGAEAQFMARLKPLLPAINQAKGEKTPAGQEIKLRNSEMLVFAGKKDFAQANALLDKIESLLAAPTGTTEGDKSAETGPFGPSRQLWEAAKKKVQGQLTQLRTAVQAEFVDTETKVNLNKLDRVLQRFQDGLGSSLDGLTKAATFGDKKVLQAQAQRILETYLTYVESDPLVAHIEANPFTPVAVKETLTKPLQYIQKQLAAFK